MHAVAPAELSARLVALRRDLHQHPELSFKEERTASVLADALAALNVTNVSRVAGTGVVARIAGRNSRAPLVAIRGDIDALPIQEATGLSFASSNAGVMHACGHDVHASWAVGAAALLASHPAEGDVVVLLQPAEEVGKGALAMIGGGALDGVQAIFGAHVDRRFTVGHVVAQAGPLAASADTFEIELVGRGAHAARPHESADPVVGMAALITSLQTIVSRRVNPAAPAVVTIGTVAAGTASNVIPDRALMRGTLRAADPETRALLQREVEHIATHVAAAHGLTARVTMGDGVPPVINSADAASWAAEAATAVLGPSAVVPLGIANMAAEDFAWYLQTVPGCFLRVGARRDGEPFIAAHSPQFDVAEEAISVGAAVLAEVGAAGVDGPRGKRIIMSEVATLRRTLGFTDLVLITLGTVIGSGIFLVPGVVMRETQGRVGLALTVWAVAGVLSLLGALTYAELGAMHPDAGGLYTYIRDAFGPLPAFLYGWASFLVIASGSVATLAVAFSGYLGQFVPLGHDGTKLVSLVLIAVLAAINIRGTRQSANVQNWTTGAKVGGLLVMSLGLLVLGTGWRTATAAPAAAFVTTSLWSGLGAAMIGVLWAYEGWQYVTFSAGETIDPQRVFPRAIAVATFVLVVLYLVANVGYLAALGPAGAAASDHVAADAAAAVFGPTAAKGLTALVLVSIFSAANGLLLTTPRLYFAMARDGVFFARLANVHERFGTPVFAIVSLAAWSAVLALTGTFEQLLTYVVFAGWIFYGLGALAVFVYRRREPNATRPFRTPGYPLSPILFVLSAALLVMNTLVTQPGRGAVGLGAVLLGTPVFYLWRAHARRQVARVA